MGDYLENREIQYSDHSKMKDLESGTTTVPNTQERQYYVRQGARVFGCVAGLWALFGGFSLMVVGAWNYILAGLMRSLFGVVTLVLEGSVFCICFKGANWYDSAQERLDNTNIFIRALVYIILPLVIFLMTVNQVVYPDQAINVLLYWIAAGCYIWLYRNN